MLTLGPADLLDGERVVAVKNVSVIVQIHEYGLSPLFGGSPMPWRRGLESIGGRLHLTNYRLVFSAHPVNRLKGRFSILLPTISEARNVSLVLSRKIRGSTAAQDYTFQVWGIPRLLAAIEQTRAALGPDQVQRLAVLIGAEPAKVIGDLEIRRALEALNLGATALGDLAVELAHVLARTASAGSDDIAAVAAVNLADFYATLINRRA